MFTWGISQVCGNKVRRSILIGCWKKAAITAIEDFSVCPILNWMDVSRYRIYRFTPDFWLSRFGWQDSWVAWGLCPLGDEDMIFEASPRCKMLSLEFSRLAGVSNSKGFSVSQVLAMRLGPNGKEWVFWENQVGLGIVESRHIYWKLMGVCVWVPPIPHHCRVFLVSSWLRSHQPWDPHHRSRHTHNDICYINYPQHAHVNATVLFAYIC